MITSCLSLRTTVALGAGLTAFVCRGKILEKVEQLFQWAITKAFYVGFQDSLTPKELADRRQTYFDQFNTRDLRVDGIDGIHISSTSDAPTGNILVCCLNHRYQKSHPRHIEPFLQRGADVVLWNPTGMCPRSFGEDLTNILRKLRHDNPAAVIALKTYCASSDPAIKAAAELDDPNIHVIVDRGHGDVQTLASSHTGLANLPLVKRILSRDFDCEGRDKIDQVRGRMLFLTPKDVDQVMDYGVKNLTRELYTKRPHASLLELSPQDHWSSWGAPTYNKVLDFLANVGVVQNHYAPVDKAAYPVPEAPSCFKRKVVPPLMKCTGWA